MNAPTHGSILLSPEQQNLLFSVQETAAALNPDLDLLMQKVVESALVIVPQADGAVVEMKEGDVLVYRAASGTIAGHVGFRIPILHSLAGMCLEQGETLTCDDTQTDPRVDRAACAALSIRSMIVVPIRYRGASIGILKISSKTPGAFNDMSRILAQFFVTAIAAGFGNVSETRAIRSLQESEARFDRAVRGSSDGIWDWDIAHERIYYSPRFKQMLGYREEEIGDRLEDWSQLLHPDDVAGVMAKIEDQFLRHKPYIAEYRLRTKSGEYLWFEARGLAEWDEHGNAIRMAGSLTNIEDRKRLQDLQEEFVYTVTHELRSPLTALKGALDLMAHLYKQDMSSSAIGMLEMAMRGSDRLMHLINDLLDLGKLEAGKMNYQIETLEIATLLQEAIQLNQMFGTKFDVDYHLIGQPECMLAELDRSRFLQVMTNLLSNAAKFSAPGSTVEIEALRQEDGCVILVRDHGKGIPAEFQDKLFQKFAQAQSGQGTGLGLNIAKTIIENMQGRITFESTEGLGTTFTLHFPLSHHQPAQALAQAAG